MEGLVGTSTGSYRITRLLTQGDTAAIYLGEDIQTYKRAALKIISLAPEKISPQPLEKQMENALPEPVDEEEKHDLESLVEKETGKMSARETKKLKRIEKKLAQDTKKLQRIETKLAQKAKNHGEKETLQPTENLTELLQKPHVKRLQAEAHLLTHFNHFHITRVLEIGVTDTIAYIVQDYIHNSAFHYHHPEGSQLSAKQILSYVKQIAETLHYLHSLKVYHRHLKPEHLLLASGNRIVLCGFGQALSPWDPPQDPLPEFKGTPIYMAPEQFHSTSLPASDQYALAIMVYEWFCGSPPFTGSPEELEEQHLHATPPSMIRKRAGLSSAVEQAVFLALAKEPARRFGNVNAFAHALEQACAFI